MSRGQLMPVANLCRVEVVHSCLYVAKQLRTLGLGDKTKLTCQAVVLEITFGNSFRRTLRLI